MPAIALPSLNGQRISTNAARGRPTLVVFWRSSCGNCKRHMPELEKLTKEYADSRLLILAMNMDDSPQKAMQFVREQRLRNSVVLLGAGAAARQLGVTRTPTTFLLDGNGNVRLIEEGAPRDTKAMTEKLDFILGKLQPEFGWRLEVARGYADAQESEDPQRKLAALQAALPPKPLKIFVDASMLGENAKSYLKAADAGIRPWHGLLRKAVQLTYTKDEADADLVIKFASQVYDPQDRYGEKTVCYQVRRVQGKRGSKGHFAATIGLGHASTGERHTAAGIAHAAAAVTGYALGLEIRRDKGSVMDADADGKTPIYQPAPDDLAILQRLYGTLNYELGCAYLKQGMYKQAAEAFDTVLTIEPKNRHVRQLRDQARRGIAGQTAPAGKALNQGGDQPTSESDR